MMRSPVVPNVYGLTLFMWIVSILTSSISDEIKTDGTKPLLSTLTNSSNNASFGNSDRILSSVIQSTFEPIGPAQVLKGYNVSSSLMGEGGPISVTYSTQPISSTTLYPADSFDNLGLKNNLTSNDEFITVPKRNNTLSKIVPRKGATEMSFLPEELIGKDSKSIIESSTTAVTRNNNNDTNNNLSNLKISTSDKVENILNANAGSTLQPNTNVSVHQDTTTTMATPLLREHKAKPTVTVAGPNNDKRPFVSPIRLRSGLPKRIDYVFQVIIALIALPALGAILFIVYKQGRDCWEKRHYRRMDFLIDGMYND
ncbi:uncharacterized protein LOC143259295 [Megalopta genalis]|uniref:uncharacterized protein LOC143259295 n=1 Tax=Megalopta genalis TaxID=115081 RepID=UPI003FCFD074